MIEYSEFISPYLTGGYRDDRVEFDEIRIDGAQITSMISLNEHFLGESGKFHLSAPIAFIAVAQLAIIYAHTDLGLQRKTHEVLVRQIDLKFRREIISHQRVPITLAFRSKRQLSGAHIYTGDIDIAKKSFFGRGTFHVPVES